MNKIELIVVPYDSGRRGYRMGAGPEHLLASGLAESLRANGVASAIRTIETKGDDGDSAFDIAAPVAAATRAAVTHGALPVILAGNCITTLGGFAGLDSRVAMLWLDAHADFNTPETSPSGFLDGMALAVITGRCFRQRTDHLRGFVPLADADLALYGVRAIDEGEATIVERIGVAHNAEGLSQALKRSTRPDLYLHVDLDVLDPSVLRANQFATDGGLTTSELLDCAHTAGRYKRIAAVAITAYDPDADVANAAPAIVLELLRQVTLHAGE